MSKPIQGELILSSPDTETGKADGELVNIPTLEEIDLIFVAYDTVQTELFEMVVKVLAALNERNGLGAKWVLECKFEDEKFSRERDKLINKLRTTHNRLIRASVDLKAVRQIMRKIAFEEYGDQIDCDKCGMPFTPERTNHKNCPNCRKDK